MNLDFGEVFKRMWNIGWNHKVLWIYQMLPGVLSILFAPLFIITNPAFALFLPKPWDQLANETWVFGLYTIVMFAFSIVFMFFGSVAQLATTYGALKVERGAQKLNFRETILECLPYFWRIVGLYTVFGGAWLLLMIVFMAFESLASLFTFGLASMCVMPLFFLFIPLGIVAYAVLELAQAAIIADDMKVMDSISHGWQIFRANILAVSLLMIILYFALSTLSSLFILPMMAPMMFFPLALSPSGDFNKTFVVLFILLFAGIFVLMFVVQGILMAFFQSAWAVAYLRLNPKPEQTASAPSVSQETTQ